MILFANITMANFSIQKTSIPNAIKMKKKHLQSLAIGIFYYNKFICTVCMTYKHTRKINIWLWHIACRQVESASYYNSAVYNLGQ